MNLNTRSSSQPRHSIRNAIIAVLCVCALANAGVFAYLTSTDRTINLFSIADGLEIEVVEPNWNPDDAQGMVPGQTIPKDPAIHNKSKADIYVFADVTIPQKDIVTANVDGSLNEKAITELFSYTVNEGWTLKETTRTDDKVTYRYLYQNRVPAGETSTPIFDTITLVNYINEQFKTEELAQQVVINGYGIQANGITNPEQAYESFLSPAASSFIADVVLNDPSISADSPYLIASTSESNGSSTSATNNYSAVFSAMSLIEGEEYSITDTRDDRVIATFIAHETDVVDGRIVITNYTNRYDEARLKGEIGGIVFWLDDEASTAYIAPKNGIYGFANNMPVEFNGAYFTQPSEGLLKQAERAVVLPGVELGNLDHMFAYSPNLKTIDISNLSASDPGALALGEAPIVNTERMFAGCSALETIIGIEDLDVSNALRMKMMFADCSSLTSLDLSNWNTSRALNMNSLFNNCTMLKEVNVSGWDTARVTDMANLFGYNNQLTKISGIESWNTAQVKSFSRAFINCYALERLDLSGWSFASATDIRYFANKCTALKELRLTIDRTAEDALLSDMISQCTVLETIIGIEKWNTAYVSTMYGLLRECPALTADCSSFNVSRVTDHGYFGANSPGVITPAWRS